MITEKVFLETIQKLNSIFPDRPLSPTAAKVYYETMSPDFTDEEFLAQLNNVLKNSFKFPPIAAFYKEKSPDIPDPVSAEEKEAYKRIRDKFQC